MIYLANKKIKKIKNPLTNRTYSHISTVMLYLSATCMITSLFNCSLLIYKIQNVNKTVLTYDEFAYEEE